MQALDVNNFDWNNADTWEQRNALIELRKKNLERQMRQAIAQEAQGQARPLGQMVGRRFIPTGTSAMLAADLIPSLTKIRGRIEETNIARGQSELAREQARAGDDVLARLAPEPTVRPMVGPMEDGAERPNIKQEVPPPTGGDRMRILRDGVKVPALRETISKLLNDQLIDQPRREDDQAFKDHELKARLAEVAASRDATSAHRAAENQRQVERDRQVALDRAADRTSREQTAAEQRALRRELIAAQVNGRPGKPLPNAVHKELAQLEDTAGSITGLRDTFKPTYSGFGQGALNTIEGYTGLGNADATNWWKTYAKNSSLEEAHRLFGASFTAAEQAKWAAADISPNMRPETIQKNLDARAEIAKRMFSNGVSRYERGGYPQVRDAFNPETPRDTVSGSPKAGTPTSAPKAGDVRNGYRFKGGNPNEASNWVPQ